MNRVVQISCIIPAYNATRYIEAAVASAVTALKNIPCVEIVLVDNNSVDDGVDKARRVLAASGLEFKIISEPRQGVSAARNTGVAASNGEWLHFLDADDILAADAIEAFLRHAGETQDDVALIYSDWARVDGALKVISNHRPNLRQGPINAAVDLLAPDQFLQVGSLLLRRRAFDEVGGFSDARLIEDVELYLRLVLADWRLEYCPATHPTALYRSHEGSLSRSDDEGFAQAVKRNARLVFDYAAASGQMTQEVIDVVSDCYFQAARSLAVLNWEAAKAVDRERRDLNLRPYPRMPRHFRLLSRSIGYLPAERVALLWRRLRAVAG